MSKFLNKTYCSVVGALCLTAAIGSPAHAGGWNGSNMTGANQGCYSCWNGSNGSGTNTSNSSGYGHKNPWWNGSNGSGTNTSNSSGYGHKHPWWNGSNGSGTNNSNSTGGNHSNCRTGKCSNYSNSTGTNNSNSSGYNNGNYNGFESLINDLKELTALLYGGKSEHAKMVDTLLNQLKDATILSEAEWQKDPSKTALQLERLKTVAYQLTNRLLSLAHSRNGSSRNYLAAEKSAFIAIGLDQAIASLGKGETGQVNAKLQQCQQKTNRLIADIRSFAGSW